MEQGNDGQAAEWKIYQALYIDDKSEEDAATLMGYKTNEKNRVPGYKQIKNVKKSIIINDCPSWVFILPLVFINVTFEQIVL